MNSTQQNIINTHKNNQLLPKTPQPINKQNKENQDLRNLNQSRKFLDKSRAKNIEIKGGRQIQILKESALQALVEKDQIIEGLLLSSMTSDPDLEEQQAAEIEELKRKYGYLIEETTELQEQLNRIHKNHNKQKQEWVEQYHRLSEEIQLLRSYIIEQEAQNQQLKNKLEQAHSQNQQIYNELISAQLSYRYLKENMLEQQEQFKSKEKNKQKLWKQSSSRSSQLQDSEHPSLQTTPLANLATKVNFVQEQQIDQQAEAIASTLSYEQQDWQPDNISIQQQITDKQHCLQGSLKEINLIDNYSVHSRNIYQQDNDSQFTTKYFRYTNQLNLQTVGVHDREQCQHIPEEAEDSLINSDMIQRRVAKERKIDTGKWWEKAGYFIGGLCIGILLLWKTPK